MYSSSEKRCKWDIIYQILSVLENGEIKKTRVMHMVYLDWRTFSKYLTFLQKCNLIIVENGYCKITDEGREILLKLREITNILNE